MEAWYKELNEYIKQNEPDKRAKSKSWQIGIGLQQVDGLATSAYLLDTAREHIEGYITMAQAQQRLWSYYDARASRRSIEDRTREADLVAARIAELLGEQAFQFSPIEWQNIHRRLFTGIFDHAGQWRTYNISKKDWVLQGKSVIYASYESIASILAYDFKTEKEFVYAGLSLPAAIKHLAKFTSDIWQIHPFCEGNTRATAVFIIKYMDTFGLKLLNDAFQKHSWYFRNALVRANYNDIQNDIYATTEYLEKFFSNLILGTDYELKNRFLHLGYKAVREGEEFQSAKNTDLNCKICTLNCSLEELSIIKLIQEQPQVTQKEIAAAIGKSVRTVQGRLNGLKARGILQRAQGRRNGRWELCEITAP